MGDYTVPATGALVLILLFTCNVNLIPIESYCFVEFFDVSHLFILVNHLN